MSISCFQAIWDFTYENFWDFAGKISTLVSLAAIFPIGWFIRWQWSLRKKKALPGQEAILIVNVGDSDIHDKVSSYAKGQIAAFKENPKLLDDKFHLQNIFFERDTDQNAATANDMRVLRAKLKDVRKTFSTVSISHIHLFLRGPMPTACIVGDEFANQFTIVFHPLQKGSYEYWGDV